MSAAAVPPVVTFRGRTHRLIASRWPTVGVFDTVASPEDLHDALLLESWTNDRVSAELTRLERLDQSEWVVNRSGATLIMAAFCHPSPGGGRFTTNALGAWYCATDVPTAIAETVYHHQRRLAHSAAGFHQTIQMRELLSRHNTSFDDVRSWRDKRPELYDPEHYTASQPFGASLRRRGSNGIMYQSVRRALGTNLVVFRPTLVGALRQGDHYDYRWTGDPAPAVVRLTRL